MNSLRFFHLIHILMLAMGIVHGSEKHMICKQVEDVFAPSQELGPANIRRGIQGIQGIQGLEGPPGVDDYERVNSTVEEHIRPVIEGLCDLENKTNVRLDEMIHGLNETLASLPKMIREQTNNDIEDKFEKMTNAFNEALASLPQKILESQGLCEFKFNDKCYWSVCHGELDMDYTQSQQRCEVNGGKVAIISSETDYNAIILYLRTKICYTTTFVYFWLSMIINPSTKVVTLPDGRQASYSGRQWFPGCLTSREAYTRILVGVNIDPSNRYQGMINYLPDSKRNGALCEI